MPAAIEISPLLNRTTPRVFIAATRMNEGKTTLALGLISALRGRSQRIGYIKPVGQRFVEVDGRKIDEDPVLINRVFGGGDPIAEMSPVAVEPEFTRKYLQGGNHAALVRAVTGAFDRIAWEKDFVVVEGTGHAGVGSVFDLSNATVASLLNAKALLITQGGIGRPVDEVALNRALFDKMGVPLVGVIMNKVRMDKFQQIEDFARKGFKRIGVDLLGVMPRLQTLENPTLGQICAQLDAFFLHAEESRDLRVDRVVVGAPGLKQGGAPIFSRTLIILPGDSADLILSLLGAAAAPGNPGPVGLVLSDHPQPQHHVMEAIRHSRLPVIATPLDSYTVASRISDLTVKTQASDGDKIETIRTLVREHIDIDRLLRAVR